MATDGNPQAKRSFTELARRAQIVTITRDLITANGYSGTSLQKIAERAGVTKAAVLYYYPSMSAVFEAVFDEASHALAADIATAIDRSNPQTAPAAYIRAVLRHFSDNPDAVRIFAEAALWTGNPHTRRERWEPLARLLEAGGWARDADSRTIAICLGGAIDGIVAEHLDDPEFDPIAAGESLISMFSSGNSPKGSGN